MLHTGYELEYCTLARTVLTHKGYMFPVTDVEADVVQEGKASESYCYVIYRYHYLSVYLQY